MAVPVVILGAAGIMALTGVGAGGNAVYKNKKAHNITEQAELMYEEAKLSAELARDACNKSLKTLGREKLNVLNTTVQRFVTDYGKIHDIDLEKSNGLFELGKFKPGQEAALEVGELEKMALSITKGVVGGVGAGALAAFGAYGAVTTFGTASTGTSIAALSGAAFHNATLAFLGGGTLAAGGGGMALGSMVLAGAAAGPAIAVLGIVMNVSASKTLDTAYSTKSQAEEIVEGLKVVTSLCNAIRDRAWMFDILLEKLAALLDFHSGKIESILENSGTDYNGYSEAEQGEIAMALSTASALKQLLDTPILNEDGSLTRGSQYTVKELRDYIDAAAQQRRNAQNTQIKKAKVLRGELLRVSAKEILGDWDWFSYKNATFRSITLSRLTRWEITDWEVIYFFDMSPQNDGTAGIFITETGLYGDLRENIAIRYEDIARLTIGTKKMDLPSKADTKSTEKKGLFLGSSFLGRIVTSGIELLVDSMPNDSVQSDSVYSGVLSITTKDDNEFQLPLANPSYLKRYLEYAISLDPLPEIIPDEFDELCSFDEF